MPINKIKARKAEKRNEIKVQAMMWWLVWASWIKGPFNLKTKLSAELQYKREDDAAKSS